MGGLEVVNDADCELSHETHTGLSHRGYHADLTAP